MVCKKMSIENRLKQVMETKNMNIKKFSETTGIPYRTLQNYLLGERKIGIEALDKINTQLGIDLNWLLTGKENTHKAVDKKLMIEWLTQWLENADEKNQIWLEIQMKRCFPEFEQWEKLKHQKMRD